MFDYIVTIAMFDELKLPSKKKTQKVMMAEVVGAYARNLQGDLGCSCASYQLVHLCEVEFGYISPHFVGMQF